MRHTTSTTRSSSRNRERRERTKRRWRSCNRFSIAGRREYHSPIDAYCDELLFAAGALLLLGGIAAFRKTRRFIANCRSANGRISGFTKEESNDGPDYYFSIIRFTDDAGVEHELRGSQGLQEPPDAGAPVAITYDPAHPANAWITGTAAPWVIPWLLVVAGVAVVIAGFAVMASRGS